MSLQEYISSGIVESYVLGLATQEERTEFEQFCAQYPEAVAVTRAFERSLEKYALENAIAAPAGIKEKILETIHTPSSFNQSFIKNPKVISMENSTLPVRKNNGGLRFVAAASVILLLGCSWFAYRFYQQNEDLKASNQELQARLNSSDSVMNKITEEQKMVSDPNVTVVNMVGTQVAPQSSSNVYWDSATSSVYLVVKNMPKLPSDQQYQLWALIDGKPKDLGVFDVNDEKVILKMNNTQKAEAFAITIEPKGGKPSPTLEKMQAMGKTKQSL